MKDDSGLEATEKTNQSMEETQVDSDIEKILREVELTTMRETEEYWLGRIEERVEAERRSLKTNFDAIVRIAEAFLTTVKKMLPNLKIAEFRIGTDYTTGAPAVMMLISDESMGQLGDVRRIARAIEHFSWTHSICSGFLWTKANSRIDTELVGHDFPFWRKNI